MKALTASAGRTVAVGLLGLFRKTSPAPLAASAMALRSSLIAGSTGTARMGVPISSEYLVASS